jgi:hypothetical protein
MKLSAAEIEQHFRDNEPEETVLEFVEPELDEVIEEPYDYRQDDWLFDDFHDSIYDDRYDDPYPCDDDYYF